MPRLLRIDASADPQHSRSRRLADAFVRAWEARGTAHTTVTRDLHANPLPHMSSVAQHWPERLRAGTELPADVDRVQTEVIDELLAADVLIISAPMYNYAYPSTLKAWIDLVHVPGLTAPFDEPTQPLQGRPAVILTARGGPNDGNTDECVISPLRWVLGDGLGMEVHAVSVSRTLAEVLPALDAEVAAAELERALAEAAELAGRLG